MNTNKLLNLTLVVLLLSVIVIDHLVVTSAQDALKVSCDTRVAYDKSGDMYCMDLGEKSVEVARK